MKNFKLSLKVAIIVALASMCMIIPVFATGNGWG